MEKSKCWLKQVIENKKNQELIRKENEKIKHKELEELGKNWNGLSNKKLTNIN